MKDKKKNPFILAEMEGIVEAFLNSENIIGNNSDSVEVAELREEIKNLERINKELKSRNKSLSSKNIKICEENEKLKKENEEMKEYYDRFDILDLED